MALPPEPIEELLARAVVVIEAAVTAVEAEGEEPPSLEAPTGYVDVGEQLVAQVVRLRVTRALAGGHVDAAPGEVLEAHKPVATYDLAPGDTGAFFLAAARGGLQIIGRHGPDTHTPAAVEAAARRRE